MPLRDVPAVRRQDIAGGSQRRPAGVSANPFGASADAPRGGHRPHGDRRLPVDRQRDQPQGRDRGRSGRVDDEPVRRRRARPRQAGPFRTAPPSPRSTAPTRRGPGSRPPSRDANLLIYLGHGNGTPSPYPYSPKSKNGLGLNATAGHGNNNVKYYGEYYVKTYLQLAPNAVVILNHLCYSAGNSEPGRTAPSRSVATQRIDNYGAPLPGDRGAGRLRRGPQRGRIHPVGLFRIEPDDAPDLRGIPQATRATATFASTQTSGATAVATPYGPRRTTIGRSSASWTSAPQPSGPRRPRRGGSARRDGPDPPRLRRARASPARRPGWPPGSGRSCADGRA